MNFETQSEPAVKLAGTIYPAVREFIRTRTGRQQGIHSAIQSDEHAITGAARITCSDLGLGLKETNKNVR